MLQLLSNNDVTFFIPPYQRNYEWTDEQCEVLLEDVKKTYDSNMLGKTAEHFFGTVTYFRDDDVPFGQPYRLVLIDGQQRITTTMLFLVALRDIIEDQNLKEFIDSKYLKNNSVSGDGEYKIKLKQVETDWEAYRKIILSEELKDKEKDSAVYRNYKFFLNKLTGLKDSGIVLSDLIDKGINKFSVITIELQPQKNEWENPQEIFESMNSLGKPLSLADLVRNYLLLGLSAETQTELYNKYWLPMEKTIPKRVSDFIRDYMQGQVKRPYPKATDSNYKELYSTFKKIFDQCDPQSILKDLSEYAQIYAYIIFDISTGNNKIDYELSDLRRINVSTAYSFLLMLMRSWEQKKFTDQEIVDILDAFRIYCLRRRIIGITNAENKVFPTLANKIPDLISAEDKKLKMFDILASQENYLRVPNDIEISRFLQTMNFYNFRYCKFFLSMIEEKLTKSRPDLSDPNLQIEHIMPQKLNEVWEKALGEDHESIHQELVHTIGNLTLIRHNQELGQKPFKDKKVIYENNAGLQIARTDITNRDKWDAASIKDRTRWITEYLLQSVFPIPDNMRKTNNFSLKEGRGLSFQELQLIGCDIDFIDDPSITARVVSDKEVEFEGKKWRLSPLTREIYTRKGKVNASRSYNGSYHWEFEGIRLADII